MGKVEALQRETLFYLCSALHKKEKTKKKRLSRKQTNKQTKEGGKTTVSERESRGGSPKTRGAMNRTKDT